MRKGNCWFDVEDHPHLTLPECQVADLVLIGFEQEVAERLVKEAAPVINILNVTGKSRLGARKMNGAKRKKRRDAEQVSLSGIEAVDDAVKSMRG